MNRPCPTIRLAVALTLAIGATSARADSVIVSNLAESIRAATPIADPQYWGAQSFSVDGPYALTTILALMGNASGSPSPVIELRSSVAGEIDTSAAGLITTFTAPDLSGAASARTFTPDQPVTLDVGELYWFIVGTTDGGFDWFYVADTAASTGAIGTFADSSDAGATWDYRDFTFPYFIEVRGDVVPEPGTALLLALGIGGLAARSRRATAA